MNITWRGHACFILESDEGVRVAFDPYDESVGYPMRPFLADVVLSSHGHHDHCCRDLLKGNPVWIQGEGEENVSGVRVTGYSTWHDDARGSLRGPNTMFLIEMDGLRILHAGDLGEQLSKTLLSRLGRIDVLMLPVGGTYTLTGEQAAQVAQAVGAAVTLPMHYKAAGVTYPITDEKPFLEAMDALDAPHMKALSLTPVNIKDAPRVVVMELEA